MKDSACPIGSELYPVEQLEFAEAMLPLALLSLPIAHQLLDFLALDEWDWLFEVLEMTLHLVNSLLTYLCPLHTLQWELQIEKHNLKHISCNLQLFMLNINKSILTTYIIWKISWLMCDTFLSLMRLWCTNTIKAREFTGCRILL